MNWKLIATLVTMCGIGLLASSTGVSTKMKLGVQVGKSVNAYDKS